MQQTEYRVVSVENILSIKRALTKLTDEVNEAIKLGWEPMGGIAIHDFRVMQALVKRR